LLRQQATFVAVAVNLQVRDAMTVRSEFLSPARCDR